MVFVRRDGKSLGLTDQSAFLKTVLASRDSRVYQEMVAIHIHFAKQFHRGLPFLAWHRLYILAFENAMRQIVPVDPTFTLPYWRWLKDRKNAYLWRDEMLGGKGAKGAVTGPFGSWTVVGAEELTDGEKTWPAKTWPDNLPIKRHFGATNSSELPNPFQVALSQFVWPFVYNRFDMAPFDRSASVGSYRNRLEGFAGAKVAKEELPLKFQPGWGIHNEVHDWFGGIMSNATFSPNDPVFWLHHAECDRLWWLWQGSVHSTAWWPTDDELKPPPPLPVPPPNRFYADFSRTTALPPWDGKTYTLGDGEPKLYPVITVADVLDIEHLRPDLLGPGTGDFSYRYDRKTL